MALQLSLVQGLLSSQVLALPALQVPPLQASCRVHGLLSVQLAVLLGNAHLPAAHWSSVQPLPSLQSLAVLQLPPQPILGANTQLPSPGLQLSIVQAWPSSQTLAVPGWQLPAVHLSAWVHLLPSSQGAALGAATHAPLAASQLSWVQTFLSSQALAAPGLHTPAEHKSPWVQSLASLHWAELATLEQTPLSGSQASLVQGLPSSQPLAAPGLQVPPAQTSPLVQALPSVQVAVLELDLQLPLVGSQASSVHGLPSLQSVALPALHAPPPQTSPAVQALPSSQPATLGVWPQSPLLLSQASAVHGLPSLQALVAPALQVPPLHRSLTVQALPSLHAAVLAGKAHLPLTQESSVHGLASPQSLGLVQLPPQPVIGL